MKTNRLFMLIQATLAAALLLVMIPLSASAAPSEGAIVAALTFTPVETAVKEMANHPSVVRFDMSLPSDCIIVRPSSVPADAVYVESILSPGKYDPRRGIIGEPMRLVVRMPGDTPSKRGIFSERLQVMADPRLDIKVGQWVSIELTDQTCTVTYHIVTKDGKTTKSTSKLDMLAKPLEKKPSP